MFYPWRMKNIMRRVCVIRACLAMLAVVILLQFSPALRIAGASVSAGSNDFNPRPSDTPAPSTLRAHPFLSYDWLPLVGTAKGIAATRQNLMRITALHPKSRHIQKNAARSLRPSGLDSSYKRTREGCVSFALSPIYLTACEILIASP